MHRKHKLPKHLFYDLKSWMLAYMLHACLHAWMLVRSVASTHNSKYANIMLQ